MQTSILPTSNLKRFQAALLKQLESFSVVKKQEDTSCPRKAQKKKDRTYRTASLAAAKAITVDAAIVAVHSELDGIFALREEQRSALGTFLDANNVFALLLTGSGNSFLNTAAHRGTPLGSN